MSDTGAPTPIACVGTQQDLDNLDDQIATIQDALASGEIPEPRTPANIAKIRAEIRSMVAAREALAHKLDACLQNQASFGLRVNGMEVTQSIQHSSGTVLLIAGKTTVVRVYVSWVVPGTVTLRGTITVGTVQVASANQVVLQATSTIPALSVQRNDATQSLNFILPAAQTGVSIATTITFVSALDVTSSLTYRPNNPADCVTFAAFSAGPALKLRMLGIR